MKRILIILAVVLLGSGLIAWSQETPKQMVGTYSALADAILALKRAEANFVRSLLDGHRHGAESYMRAGEAGKAAAEIALWANEGDNAVGGVRKRLLEGGHHHNAEGEAKGIYEPGYVVVTKKAKVAALAAAGALRQAATAEEREKAWKQFLAVVDSLKASD
jgi:hypothetical protein